MNGVDILQDQKCLIVNFGFKNPLPFPEIKLSPDPKFHLNVGSLGLNSPSKCSIVVIGGKYLEQVDEVMRMVDKITEDIAWMPSAVFLMAEKPGQDIKFNVSARDNMSPTMYQVPASRSSVVQFVMTCPGMSHSSTFTLHMRDSGEVDDGKVWGDLCREKRVNIAYNDDPDWFAVDKKTGRMGNDWDEKGRLVRKSVDLQRIDELFIPWNWEILDSFFKHNDVVPVWEDCDFTWGSYDEELGRWTGAVGKVRRSKT